MRKSLVTAVVLAAAVGAMPASAKVYDLTFSGSDCANAQIISGICGPVSGTAQITTAGPLNALGGHDVLEFSGVQNGASFHETGSVGVVADTKNLVFALGSEWLIEYDNTAYTSGPAFDAYGPLGTSPSNPGSFIDLFYQSGQYWDDVWDPTTQSLYAMPLSTFTVAQVPEPATWAMLLASLLGMGAVVRAARRDMRRIADRSLEVA